MRFILSILLFSFISFNIATSEQHIISIDYPNKKLINFGPCFIGDSLHTYFDLYYDGQENVYIQNGEPTLKVFESNFDYSDLKNQFRRFDPDMKRQPLPRILNFQQANLKLPFYFYSDSNLVTFPLGIYHANAMIALAKSSDNSVIIADTFILKAKKTDLYIDGFNDSLNFDSVYVNPIYNKELIWLVKSTKMPTVEVTNQTLNYLSPKIDDEFIVPENRKGITFNEKYQTLPWNIAYNPKNIGKDSAILKLYYQPDKINFPDSIRFTSIKLYGLGVEQKVNLIESNFNINKDTIYLGNIKTGSRTIVTGILENFGNISVNSTEETIYNAIDDNSEIICKINKKAFIGKSLKTGEKTQFQIYCEPQKDGLFIEKYVIKTNIKSRNIYGVPQDVENKVIYLKGNATSPNIRIPIDTLNFGTVVINEISCPSKKDTVINITNSGTADLIVKSINIIPNEKFLVSENSFQLMPGQTKQLTISFISDDGVLGEFISSLQFNTNMTNPMYSIGLKVTRIPRVKSWLDIPKNIKAKPGRLVNIPILISDKDYNSKPAKYAKNFSTIITYDSTLLRYENRILVGTASEGADANINLTNSGKIQLFLSNKSDYFKPNDTLLILQFRTYLGEVTSTDIAFEKNITRFGDGLCDNVLNTDGTIENGVFSIDSVCGLQYKTKINHNYIIINKINPTPAYSEVYIEFTVSDSDVCNFEICNLFGQTVKNFGKKNVEIGNNEIYLNLSTINPGVYIIRISNSYSIFQKTLLISN